MPPSVHVTLLRDISIHKSITLRQTPRCHMHKTLLRNLIFVPLLVYKSTSFLYEDTFVAGCIDGLPDVVTSSRYTEGKKRKNNSKKKTQRFELQWNSLEPSIKH